MAAVIPPALKSADVQRFATRAAQLAKFRPIITYWCEYYILQQILQKQLHTSDAECSSYALQLMDKLESFKAENAANDAVIDDVAAKAYVEAFALETFGRGDEAQQLNRVSRQTADTLQAAATFLDLLAIWGPLEPEITSKAKFAKYHAVRIAKAIKAGEDPNASNPVIEPPKLAQANDPDDIEAELKDLQRQDDAGVYQQPTVESVPDIVQPNLPPPTMHDDPVQFQSPFTHATISHGHGVVPPPKQPEAEVSPIEPTHNSRAASIGGGYFPAVSEPETPVDVNSMAPIDPPSSLAAPPPPQSPTNAADFYNTVALSPSSPDLGIASPDRPGRPTPHQMNSRPSVPHPVSPPTQLPAPMPLPAVNQIVPPQPPAPIPAATTAQVSNGPYNTDDESVLTAQKHAKWAISALNFEDVNTAVKELRIALQSLGAG